MFLLMASKRRLQPRSGSRRQEARERIFINCSIVHICWADTTKGDAVGGARLTIETGAKVPIGITLWICGFDRTFNIIGRLMHIAMSLPRTLGTVLRRSAHLAVMIAEMPTDRQLSTRNPYCFSTSCAYSSQTSGTFTGSRHFRMNSSVCGISLPFFQGHATISAAHSAQW